MPKETDPAFWERAIKFVREHFSKYASTEQTISAGAREEGVSAETLRRWAHQTDIDAGERERRTGNELAEIGRSKAENIR